MAPFTFLQSFHLCAEVSAWLRVWQTTCQLPSVLGSAQLWYSTPKFSHPCSTALLKEATIAWHQLAPHLNVLLLISVSWRLASRPFRTKQGHAASLFNGDVVMSHSLLAERAAPPQHPAAAGRAAAPAPPRSERGTAVWGGWGKATGADGELNLFACIFQTREHRGALSTPCLLRFALAQVPGGRRAAVLRGQQ